MNFWSMFRKLLLFMARNLKSGTQRKELLSLVSKWYLCSSALLLGQPLPLWVRHQCTGSPLAGTDLQSELNGDQKQTIHLNKEVPRQ